MSITIAKLRSEKKKLIMLAKKLKMIEKAKEEEKMLKLEIKRLKLRVGKGVVSKVRRISKKIKSAATSPEAKRKLKTIKKDTVKTFRILKKIARRIAD
ncbi:unnamed protein product [marine sediment metagenome]|uniref:Uncharacterized protein n=1 Tax=marine sediment metagenome TaxID=412755 RepID=X1CJK7_9ZZZZ